jgi:tRNA threonylcarbamoyl adenosine modification protein YeaZ
LTEFTGSSAVADDDSNKTPMRVLAIDTALAVCAAAVLDTEQPARSVRESLPMVRGHAEALMPLVARVMDQANIEFADLDRIAVTTGPGSFTGLRVGISAARGIALAAGKPALGLSTLSCYAAPHITQDDLVPVVVAIDARHEQVYLQVFGTAGRTLVSPRIATVREAVRTATWGPVRIVGSSAKALAAAWPAGQPAPALVEARPAPDIDWVARLGAAAQDGYASPKPLYLRAPDARPQDASRLPRR